MFFDLKLLKIIFYNSFPYLVLHSVPVFLSVVKLIKSFKFNKLFAVLSEREHKVNYRHTASSIMPSAVPG